MNLKLMSKAEYDRVSPYTQGYAVYWEGDQEGSELKGLTNPYAAGTKAHDDWNRGQQAATQDAQDSEE